MHPLFFFFFLLRRKVCDASEHYFFAANKRRKDFFNLNCGDCARVRAILVVFSPYSRRFERDSREKLFLLYFCEVDRFFVEKTGSTSRDVRAWKKSFKTRV